MWASLNSGAAEAIRSADSDGGGFDQAVAEVEVFVGDGWKAAALPRMAALRVGCMRRFAECWREVTAAQ